MTTLELKLVAPIETTIGDIDGICLTITHPLKLGDVEISGECKLGDVSLPIFSIKEDDPKDAFFYMPSLGEPMAFFIKPKLLSHFTRCVACFKYVMIHELCHMLSLFKVPPPRTLSAFGNEIRNAAHNYIEDAVIDYTNLKIGNITARDINLYIIHSYGREKIDFVGESQIDGFEKLVYTARWAAFNEFTAVSSMKDFVSSSVDIPIHTYKAYIRLIYVFRNLGRLRTIEPVYSAIEDLAETFFCKDRWDVIRARWRSVPLGLLHGFRSITDMYRIVYSNLADLHKDKPELKAMVSDCITLMSGHNLNSVNFRSTTFSQKNRIFLKAVANEGMSWRRLFTRALAGLYQKTALDNIEELDEETIGYTRALLGDKVKLACKRINRQRRKD